MPDDKKTGYCDNCKWNREIRQSHPYGSTTATETLGECASEAEFPDDDKMVDVYGIEVPCPNWELLVSVCRRHGEYEGRDICPACDAEMANAQAERYDPDFAGSES